MSFYSDDESATANVLKKLNPAEAGEEQVNEIESLKAQLSKALKENEELEKLREANSALQARLQAAEEYGKQVKVLRAELAASDATYAELEVAADALAALVQKREAELAEVQKHGEERERRLAELEEELKKSAESNKLIQTLSSSSDKKLCTLSSVFIDGKINSEKLNGKVLVVKKLEQKDNNVWYVDDVEISNDCARFYFSPEIYVINQKKFSSISNRIMHDNIETLILKFISVTYTDYKNLISSCTNVNTVDISFAAVKDESGAVIEIDQLLKNIFDKNTGIMNIKYSAREHEAISAQKLSQLPTFPKLQKFEIKFLQKGFNLTAFGEFMKKHLNTEIYLLFWTEGDDEFQQEVEDAEKKLRRTLPSTCKLTIDFY